MDKLPIGVWGISNTASLNVWEMSDGNDGMLVGVNDDTPEWCEIEHDLDGNEDDVYAYIVFHDSRWRLDECMRTNR